MFSCFCLETSLLRESAGTYDVLAHTQEYKHSTRCDEKAFSFLSILCRYSVLAQYPLGTGGSERLNTRQERELDGKWSAIRRRKEGRKEGRREYPHAP